MRNKSQWKLAMKEVNQPGDKLGQAWMFILVVRLWSQRKERMDCLISNNAEMLKEKYSLSDCSSSLTK